VTRLLLWAAGVAVRTWTRIYTCGLPPLSRDVRRAEIESDLWESQHDPDRGSGPGAAGHVLLRLLLGLPDDVFWRLTHAAGRRVAMLGTVATLLLFLAIWAYVHSLQSLPTPPARPMQFVSDRPEIPPPPPPPPPARPPNLQ
jgi:hypothetical protein